MAAAFIHYFLGLGIAFLFGYTGLEAAVIGLVGTLQDLDFLSVFFYRRMMKSRFTRVLMHRGITHTFVFVFVVSAVVLGFSPVSSLIVLCNFTLHLFVDYVTAWGVSPFQPFSDKKYSLGLMTIFDGPLTVLSFFVGVSGFISVNVTWLFALFFGYILLRFALKRRLKHKDLVPMGNFTYAFCNTGDDYEVGKVNILGREEVISVARMESGIDSTLLEEIKFKIEDSMLSHFIKYPTYSIEGNSIKIRDARSYLFPRSAQAGFTLFFDREAENLYMVAAGKKIELS